MPPNERPLLIEDLRPNDALSPHEQAKRAAEQKQLYADLLILSFDIAGIFDPTPICDGFSAGASAGKGEFAQAGISVASMVPLLGDLAKWGKLDKARKTITNVIEWAKKDLEFAKMVTPLLKKIGAAIGEVLESSVGKNCLPDGAADILKSIKGKIDEFLSESAKGWTKASREYIEKTRKAFEESGGVREQFWKNEFAKNPNAYTKQNQGLIKQGKAPIGTDGKPMVLHHKTPIEYGGTNDFSNLEPMRYSDHSLIPEFGPLHTPPF